MSESGGKLSDEMQTKPVAFVFAYCHSGNSIIDFTGLE